VSCALAAGAYRGRTAGVPFAVFVHASAVSAGSPHMTWNTLAEMAAIGAVIGTHSFYHPHIGQSLAGQDSTSYRIWVGDDLRRAPAGSDAALQSRHLHGASGIGATTPCSHVSTCGRCPNSRRSEPQAA
jgi:hypothetical protein